MKKLGWKKASYVICATALVGWVVFRFAAIGSENSRYVFNAVRVAQEQGLPVEVLEVKKQSEILKEPIGIKNNKAFIASARIGKFKVGQKIGDGKIVSVSQNLDLDTGMHVVRTKNVSDGLHYAEVVKNGFLVPVHAVSDNTVFVIEDGVARTREVVVVDKDYDNALIISGLQDGDRLILSKVNSGDKVRVK